MANIIDRTLQSLGLQRTEKAQVPAKTGPKIGQLMGGSRIAYVSSLGSQRQQINAYLDWPYAAATTIAEHLAAIDIRLYVNRSSTKNAVLIRRMVNDPKFTARMMKQQVEVIKRDSKGNPIKKDGAIVKVNMASLDEIDNHPLLDLLHAPNDYMTKDEFFMLTAIHLELVGEAFWVLIRDSRGLPVKMYPLLPYLVTVVPHETDFVAGYVYNVPGGDPIPLAVQDVIHHKNIDPQNPWRGMGVIRAAARAIDTDTNAAEYNRNFFYNSATPSGVLQAPPGVDMDEDAYTRLRQEWDEKYGGSLNSHRVAILEGGMQFQQISVSQQDMEFLEGRKFNRDQILAMFRVPPSILGIVENVNRANAEAAEYTFAKGNIKPKMTRLVNRITEDLAVQFDSKLVVGFSDPVPEDKEFMLKEKQTSLNAWRTIDEIRAIEGDTDLPNNVGNTLYVANNLVPIGDAADPASLKPTQPDAPINTPPEDSEDIKSIKATQEKILEKLDSLDVKKKFRPKLYHSEAQRKAIGDAFWLKIEHAALRHEVAFIRATRHSFDLQKEEVMRKLKRAVNTKGVHKGIIEDLKLDKAKWVAQFAKDTRPVYADNMQEAASLGAILVGSGRVDMTSPDFVKYFKDRPNLVGDSVYAETAKQLGATLTEGVSAGESITQLTDRVEAIYGAAASFRAERIARTETVSSANYATQESWKQSGVVEGKEWFADPDACAFCLEMNGQRTYLDDTYFNKGDSLTINTIGKDGSEIQKTLNMDFTDIDSPPIHANCRCTLLPVFEYTDSGSDTSAQSSQSDTPDFSDTSSVESAFDTAKYSDLSQEEMNQAVGDYLAQSSPVLGSEIVRGLDFTTQFQTWDRLNVATDAVDEELVQKYVQDFKNGDTFPPPVAINFSGSNNKFTVIDGRHRIAAMQELGATGIPVLVGDPQGYFPLDNLR